MMNCWESEPATRPSFVDLTQQLKHMENQHKVRFYRKLWQQRNSPTAMYIIEGIKKLEEILFSFGSKSCFFTFYVCCWVMSHKFW